MSYYLICALGPGVGILTLLFTVFKLEREDMTLYAKFTDGDVLFTSSVSGFIFVLFALFIKLICINLVS